MRAAGSRTPPVPEEASLPGFSPQCGPTAQAAAALAVALAAPSSAFPGSRCSWDGPAPPSSADGLVMPASPCSRGANGPIWLPSCGPCGRCVGSVRGALDARPPAPVRLRRSLGVTRSAFPRGERRGSGCGSASCGRSPAPAGWCPAKRSSGALEPGEPWGASLLASKTGAFPHPSSAAVLNPRHPSRTFWRK